MLTSKKVGALSVINDRKGLDFLFKTLLLLSLYKFWFGHRWPSYHNTTAQPERTGQLFCLRGAVALQLRLLSAFVWL